MKKLIYIITGLAIFFAGYSISVTPSYDTFDIALAIERARSELNANQEIVVFDSKNPFNFYDIFNRIEEISYQQVYGILTKPDSVGVFPLIMGVAGSAGWGDQQLVSTIGSLIVFVAQLIFFWNFTRSMNKGEVAGNDPWGGTTFEWSTSSPPPKHNFEKLPEMN